MRLIKIEGYELKVADEALLIKPIRRLWNQDRSQKKETFYQQMSYLYFMVSPQSSYSYILDLQERASEIIRQEGLPENFKPSALLQEAMEIYKKHTITPSQKLLESSLIAADTISKFLRDPEILRDEDDKGKPKHTVTEISRALKDVEGIINSLQNLQRKVDQELAETGKARGSQELTLGDIGFD